MSDALDYLKKVRPEAAEAYFQFLKLSAGQLDDKTRYLISVVTKIDNQTETGLRQYIKRAMAAGNTADDILDAILIAFPSLGLSKIIWAINIILDMGIAEFSPDVLNAQPGWHRVCEATELTQEISYFNIDKQGIFVYQNDKSVSVYAAVCPHLYTQLTLENYHDGVFTCPTHQWEFNASTGACVEKGDKPLKIFPHKFDQNHLEAYW